MIYRLVIAPIQQQEGQISLTSSQQHYLKGVLRLKSGDRFVAMDGRGKSWIAALMGTSAKIIEPLREATELSVAITLMAALAKGTGFEQVVRCGTELGVASFIPLISDRTLLKPSPHKLERWRRIAQEAAEQAERQIVPAISEPVSFGAALDLIKSEEVREVTLKKYICVARVDAHPLLQCLEQQPANHLVLATGPEGGWTQQEVEQAIAAGFQPVSLGRRILRAVTAPVVALSLAAATAEIANQ